MYNAGLAVFKSVSEVGRIASTGTHVATSPRIAEEERLRELAGVGAGQDEEVVIVELAVPGQSLPSEVA